MKSLKITFEHGRIWKAEASDGRMATGASLHSALDKVRFGDERTNNIENDGYDALRSIFYSIKDSGGTGQIAKGQASG